jgi:hypothetical protein
MTLVHVGFGFALCGLEAGRADLALGGLAAAALGLVWAAVR